MLIKIANRNILRNKRRSLIVIISIVVGISSMMIYDAFMNGMLDQQIDNQLSLSVSHIQIHNHGYSENKVLKNYIKSDKVEEALNADKNISHWSKRVNVFGMISSAGNSSGATIRGVQFDREKNVTAISSKIIEGSYLTGAEREIIISKQTAEKLETELGDKIVSISATVDGKVSSELFRVCGIFQTAITEFDKMTAFVNLPDLQKMTELGDNVNEYAIIFPNTDLVLDYKAELISALDGENTDVESYIDLLPMLVSTIEASKMSMIAVYLIIAIGVLFGIINTMLMSVFERINEFGVLKSIGMRPGKLFRMILLEAFTLGVLGTISGFLVGLGAIYMLSSGGIDLSNFSDGLTSVGVDSIIYPVLNFNVIANALFIMPFATVFGAIWPAFKAARLQPTDAMRYV
ncbi:MAG: FtsX-like permease family protein [Candidatus Kapabacteria bacterium]|jgi:putative ABC transport system permease protein|nr:FtsX-like permease family protein [Candidatus Kapabacteria bacterium]